MRQSNEKTDPKLPHNRDKSTMRRAFLYARRRFAFLLSAVIMLIWPDPSNVAVSSIYPIHATNIVVNRDLSCWTQTVMIHSPTLKLQKEWGSCWKLKFFLSRFESDDYMLHRGIPDEFNSFLSSELVHPSAISKSSESEVWGKQRQVHVIHHLRARKWVFTRSFGPCKGPMLCLWLDIQSLVRFSSFV